MAKSRAGLRKVTKTVRGKKGTVRRSYWTKSKALMNPGAKAYKKNSSLASASMGARVGLVSGLLGAHRLRGGSLGSNVGAHLAARSQRRQFGVTGKGVWQKAKHFVATDVGHGVGHVAGVVAHEGIRRALGRKSAFGGRGGVG